MYAEVTSFKVKPEFVAESPKQTEKFVALHKSLKGFKSQTFLIDEESRDAVALSLWETKEDLDAALAVCIPELQKASNLLDGEPTLKVYKVAYKD